MGWFGELSLALPWARGIGAWPHGRKVKTMDWTPLEALPRPKLGELFGDSGRVAALSDTLELADWAIRFDWSKKIGRASCRERV